MRNPDPSRAAARCGLFAALVALAVTACGSDPRENVGTSRSAIVGGDADTDDPAVVHLAASNCSGTLVAPRAVLTAAHCAVAAGDPVSFSDGTIVSALAFHPHPSWDPTTVQNDIAIVVLAEASSVAPLPLFAGPFDDALVGARVRIVGYGATGDGGPAGTKHTGFTTIASYDDTTFSDSASPSASCGGDSGGPALLSVDGVERVAGVTSRGDQACSAFGVKTRVDAFLASFVTPALAATDPGAVAVGATCDDDEECASKACVAAADSDRVHYCSATCAADRDCPTLHGLRRQRVPLRAPLAGGARRSMRSERRLRGRFVRGRDVRWSSNMQRALRCDRRESLSKRIHVQRDRELERDRVLPVGGDGRAVCERRLHDRAGNRGELELRDLGRSRLSLCAPAVTASRPPASTRALRASRRFPRRAG